MAMKRKGLRRKLEEAVGAASRLLLVPSDEIPSAFALMRKVRKTRARLQRQVDRRRELQEARLMPLRLQVFLG